MHEIPHHHHRHRRRHATHFFPLLLLLLLLLKFHPIKSEIQTIQISSDDRPFILLQDFGFTNPGHISISVSSISVTPTPTPTHLSFMGCFYGPTPARKPMQLAVLNDACIIGHPYIFPIFLLNQRPNLSPFNKTIFISIPDLYHIFLVNCAKNSTISMTLHLETFNLDSNSHPTYIDHHFAHLPTALFVFSAIFAFFLLTYAHACYKNKHFLHKIHALMALLLLSRSLELLCHSGSQSSIKLTGTPRFWNIPWLTLYFARNVLFINVIMLVRTGWSLFRPCLQKTEKYAIGTAIVIQVFAGACFVLIQSFGPSNRSYKYWTVSYYAFDFLCYVFLIFPVSKSIDNLGISAKTEGKEAKRLVHQRVYENLEMVTYVYFGVTRVGLFVLRAITSYNFWFLSIVLEMGVEFVFYVVVYAMFWPNARYDYVVLDDGEEECSSVALSGSIIEV